MKAENDTVGRLRRPIRLVMAGSLCVLLCGACAWRAAILSPAEGLVAFDPDAERWITEAEVWEEILAARYVLLGEHHDNPDHHRLQAGILRELAARGRRPALAFEMLGADVRDAIAEFQAAGRADPEALRGVVEWDQSGWPAWPLYEPIFAAGLDAGMPIIAAQVPLALRKGLTAEGLQALPSGPVREIATRPLPEASQADLEEEIREGHCNRIPLDLIPRMVEIQRIWDAWMADAIRAAATQDGAVLIVGRAHARRERAIPWALAQFEPGAQTLSIAFVEASPDDWQHWADDERHQLSSYDLVYVTRPIDREDPCDRIPVIDPPAES
ncbi:MAG: ChaN family lipoprotein [bacterium]|nr:ChaN family lipoprotein [bacterium]